MQGVVTDRHDAILNKYIWGKRGFPYGHGHGISQMQMVGTKKSPKETSVIQTHIQSIALYLILGRRQCYPGVQTKNPCGVSAHCFGSIIMQNGASFE